MKLKRLVGCLLVVLLTGLTLPASGLSLKAMDLPDPENGASDAGPSTMKVSGLLRHHIALKQEQIEQPRPENLQHMQTLGLQTDDLSRQSVFVHFDQFPTADQMGELETLGVTLFEDTWIPPVGDHPDGFMIAHMPIEEADDLAAMEYVTYLNTAEETHRPMNDLGTAAVKADELWNLGYDGTGVTIAVLDSGLDITHADIPTPVVGVDYSGYPITDTTIANQISAHGTHVVGSALGRGVYNAAYKGSAAGADLVFLKIGNDTDARASTAAQAAAIRAAVDTYNADIITMSYGGWSTYMDGTSEGAQAVDYAFSQGAVIFMAAGNDANDERHCSGTVESNSSTDFIRVDVADPFSPPPDDHTALYFRLIWYDGLGTSNDLDLEIYDAGYNQLTTDVVIQEDPESPRGTEADLTYYDVWLTSAGTFYLKVVNNSATAQDFHIYSYWREVTFAEPDPAYTVASPGTANKAITVGAYVTRESWTDWQGNPGDYGETLSNMATFSSQGPRADGVKKPNIAAPGSAIISARDSDVPTADEYIISDNGINDGTQPHHYSVMQGTSMATPLAAGAAALLLEKYPDLKGHPEVIRDRIQRTADNNGLQTNTDGYGYLDILAAAKLIESPTTTEPGYAGPHNAPTKLLIRILKPAVGLNAADFAVTIGGGNANIITLYEGRTEYVLEVMAPPQPANGTFDLEVTVSGNSETQSDAVSYDDSNDVDVMLVIDRSGSMDYGFYGPFSYIEPAKIAAQQFVDLMFDGSQIGVASFATSASLDFDLTPITSGTRGQAKDAIDRLVASGSTSIGDGLQVGQYELTTEGIATHPWAMVLLSDGEENTAPFVADVLPDIVSTKTVVHTIALGEYSDEELMLDIAAHTGGTYNMAPTADQLAEIYNTIVGDVSSQQVLLSRTGIIVQGRTDQASVVIDSTIAEATFSVNWSHSANTLTLTLEDPNGYTIDPSVAASNSEVTHISGPTYAYYRIRPSTLITGVWKMMIAGGSFASPSVQAMASTGEESYTALVMGRISGAGLTMHAYFDKLSYQANEPIKLSITLSDHEPIPDGEVMAIVGPLITVGPSPQVQASEALPNPILMLYDDGRHGDGLANNGVYANTLDGSNTVNEGVYNFQVFATGTANFGDMFARLLQKNVSVGLDSSSFTSTYQEVALSHKCYLPLVLKP